MMNRAVTTLRAFATRSLLLLAAQSAVAGVTVVLAVMLSHPELFAAVPGESACSIGHGPARMVIACPALFFYSWPLLWLSAGVFFTVVLGNLREGREWLEFRRATEARSLHHGASQCACGRGRL